jgi:hypothetical protein
MTFNIQQFRSNLQFDGARPSKFDVTITNPVNNNAAIDIPFKVRAASIPESNLGVAPVMYFGRTVKLAGDRTFDDWAVSVINDEDFLVRDGLEQWSNQINALQSNINQFPTSSSSLYTSTALVTQYAKTGEPIRTYQFFNLWPRSVGKIELSWDAANQIEVFPVVFCYDYYEIVNPSVTGFAGGNF